jgi:hypothetical protein
MTFYTWWLMKQPPPERTSVESERILKFLTDWRKRLLQTPAEMLTDEEFGQLLTLNTLIYFIQNP